MNQPTPPAHRHPATRFSSAAATYDRHAGLHRTVALELMRLMDGAPSPRRILDGGCGTGVLTCELAGRFPEACIDALDYSDEMLAVARGKLPPQERIRWIAADLRTYDPGIRYDWIATSSALQWATPLDKTLAHLAGLLAPGGRLFMAVMTRGTLDELHRLRMELTPDNVPPRRLPESADLVKATRHGGLSLEHAHGTAYAVPYDDAAQLLRSLHEQGVTGGSLSRGPRPLSRGDLDRLIACYQQRHRDPDGRVTATYEVGFFVALKEPAS